MPFSHNGLKTTAGIQVFSQVNKYTHIISYRILYGNVQGCVFAKNCPVYLNWTDYIILFLMQQTPRAIVVKCDGSVYDVDVYVGPSFMFYRR